MTQKELLYLEDAICHEKNLEKICTNIASKLQDENLKSYMNNEASIHTQVKTNLTNMLKEVANGQ